MWWGAPSLVLPSPCPVRSRIGTGNFDSVSKEHFGPIFCAKILFSCSAIEARLGADNGGSADALLAERATYGLWQAQLGNIGDRRAH